MRKSSNFPSVSGFSLSIMIGFALFVAEPLVVTNDVQAEGYHNSAVLAGKRAFKPRGIINRVGTSRSGVRYGKLRRSHKHHRPNYRLHKRYREIARRNIRVERNNELRRLRASTRRSGPNGRFLSRGEREYLLNGGYIVPNNNSGLQGAGGINSNACPSGHDCGYRIYSDGTGPRIITPGVRLGNGLPSYDGLNGPKVITLVV